MPLTTYTANKLQNLMFGMSETWYVALSTSEPKINGDDFTEPPAVNNYSRVLVPRKHWTPIDKGAHVNALPIVYPEATGPWGEITHIGLFDKIQGGNLICFSAMLQDESQPPHSPQRGDILSLAQHGFSVKLG